MCIHCVQLSYLEALGVDKASREALDKGAASVAISQIKKIKQETQEADIGLATQAQRSLLSDLGAKDMAQKPQLTKEEASRLITYMKDCQPPSTKIKKAPTLKTQKFNKIKVPNKINAIIETIW